MYDDDGVQVDRPTQPRPLVEVALPVTDPDIVIDDHDTGLAMGQLMETWTTRSNGRLETVCVEGDHLDAIAALGPARARVLTVPARHALALLAWSGASGGAQGRRRGGAIGRFGVWWLLVALCDLDDKWPPSAERLGAAISGLRWFLWDAFEPDSGWMLRVAVESPDDGLAWAFVADDGD